MMAQGRPPLRSGLLIVVASVIGYGVTLGTTPLLTRIVEPVVFGGFAVALAIASSFIGVASLRLEVISLGEDSDARAASLRILALRSILIFAVFVLLIVAMYCVITQDFTFLWVPLMLVMGSVPPIALAKLQRERRYQAIAGDSFVQGAGMGLFQLLLAYVWPVMGSLVVGFGLSRVALVRHLEFKRLLKPLPEGLWRQYGASARRAGLSAGINSLAGQAPLLLSGILLSPLYAGLLAMAFRIFVGPLTIIGNAAAHLSMGEISRLLREGDRRASQIFVRGVAGLGALAAPLLVGALVYGPQLVSWILGDGWSEVGDMVRALALGAVFQFAVAPFSQLLNVGGDNSWLLLWDAIRLLLFISIFTIPAVVGMGIMTTLWIFSIVQVFLYTWMAARIRHRLSAMTLKNHTSVA